MVNYDILILKTHKIETIGDSNYRRLDSCSLQFLQKYHLQCLNSLDWVILWNNIVKVTTVISYVKSRLSKYKLPAPYNFRDMVEVRF